MFTRPTVFVVGAGASAELNFPTGDKLTVELARKLNIRHENMWDLRSGDATIVEAVRFHIQQLEERDPNPYHHAGRAIAGAMVQAISIDNFLHAHSDDDHITFMGKLGIAASILEAERASYIADNENEREVDLDGGKNSWLSVAFKMMHEGIDKQSVENIFDNISFVTFNYDRAIEHYFTGAIANYYRLPLDISADIVARKLRIEHPYGQIGRLPWQARPGAKALAFGGKTQARDLIEISSQIRTFTERVEVGQMIDRMRTMLEEAEAVVFLGFAYGEMNMQLLQVDRINPVSIFGTTMGMSDPNAAMVNRELRSVIGDGSMNLASMKASDFLYAYWKPIMRA